MTLLMRIENISKLWKLMLPDIALPSPAWMGRWAESAPDVAIERAIVRASKVFATDRNKAVIPEVVHRYVSGVVRNETGPHTFQMKGANER